MIASLRPSTGVMVRQLCYAKLAKENAMANDTDNLVLEHLRAIRSDLDDLKADMHDMKVRLTAVEEGLAGVHRRLDRLDQRVDRIERRLQLAET